MQYLFLLYSDETQAPEPPKDPKEFQAWIQPWADYTQALKDAGVFVGGDALQPTATATTVTNVGSAEPVLTDGPFAETREQLGGYYLVDCKDLDQALVWAGKCPIVHYGKCEVRPVQTFS
ncbi:MAG: YciI family protein [Polyangiales bacterium]